MTQLQTAAASASPSGAASEKFEGDLYVIAANAANFQRAKIHSGAPLEQTDPGNVTATVDQTSHYINKTVGQATSIELPPIADFPQGVPFKVKDGKRDANTNPITLTTPGSETIDGAATLVGSSDGCYVEVFSDGTNWYSGPVQGTWTPT